MVNVGDDIWLHGLRICPDLDTCMYTLGGGIDTERGWGRAGETWAVRDELAAYGAEPDWFGLGDRDIATHLVRTRMLRAGYPLSDVTAALCHRWQPGRHAAARHRRPRRDPRRRRRPGHRAEGAARRSTSRSGGSGTRPSCPRTGSSPSAPRRRRVLPAARDAILEADAVLLAPSNPVVSIGALLDVPGVRDALRDTPAKVVGLSPIVGGRPLRGMADACLTAIGVETTRRGGGPALRRARRRRAARRLAGAHRRRRRRARASRSRPCRC